METAGEQLLKLAGECTFLLQMHRGRSINVDLINHHPF
jgi:hypothetical protein